MSAPKWVNFKGKVERSERGGFVVIRFNEAVGPASNTFTVVSTANHIPGLFLESLTPGTDVKGRAKADYRELPVVTELEVLGRT